MLAWFMDEGPAPLEAAYFMSDAELRALWDAHSAAIVADWCKTAPGTRPPHWWQYDAPEQRRRLGGKGTPCHEVMAHVPAYRLGIPSDWMADGFDQIDPPAFESEAAFLKRHKLLLPGEAARLTERSRNEL